MLYLYDKAIIDDLNECLGKDTVRVIDPEAVVDIVDGHSQKRSLLPRGTFDAPTTLLWLESGRGESGRGGIEPRRADGRG